MPHVTLPRIGTATAWRDAARGFLTAGLPPEQITWGDGTTQTGLFDDPAPAPSAGSATVPRSFLALANTVVWHSDPTRFAQLYSFLYRLRDAPHLMQDRGDPQLAKLRSMEKNVRRCQHKMKAFVRFREIGAPTDNRRSFAAWFEPTHHTIEPTAQFFARRFADMDWRILTPDVSVFFEKGALRFELDHPRPDLTHDASEVLWVTYFRNIFNPARLKVQAMQSEMPKKYWKNMPEAAAIPELIAGAPARARQMAQAAPTLPPVRAAAAQAQQAALQSVWDGAPEELDRDIHACTRCPLHKSATQAVPGEGPHDATVMIVGEQPGDHEDLQGRPFVGPAGALFDKIAAQAGLNR
ncbi:MAG: TIGR03915 family putative DNA repair protein, partial [Roseobacter sp.]|nr:TIGR03915 family putative DNA repair protein [Roseobacter sp.]